MKNSLMVLVGFMAAASIAATGQGTVTPSEAGTNTAPTAIAAPGLKPHDSRYQLRKSDSFEVDFSFSPEFNQTVIVEPDGYITLKEIGSIYVAGETVPELTENLKTAYAKILRDPVIAVVLKDFEKPSFIATGQVEKPGRYELRGPLTVTQAVAIAGGFNDKSKHSQVVVFHPTTGGIYEAKLINVKKLLASRNLKEDITLQPGDLIYVPQNTISKIQRFLPSSALGAYYNPNGI